MAIVILKNPQQHCTPFTCFTCCVIRLFSYILRTRTYNFTKLFGYIDVLYFKGYILRNAHLCDVYHILVTASVLLWLLPCLRNPHQPCKPFICFTFYFISVCSYILRTHTLKYISSEMHPYMKVTISWYLLVCSYSYCPA